MMSSLPSLTSLSPPDFGGNNAEFNQLVVSGDRNEEYALRIDKGSWMQFAYVNGTLKVLGETILSNTDVQGELSVREPTSPRHAASREYVDSCFASHPITFTGTLDSLAVSGLADFQGDIRVNDPTSPESAINLYYVTTNFQPLDAKLSALSTNTPTANHLLVGDGTLYVPKSPSDIRQTLELGSLAVRNDFSYGELTGLPSLGSLVSKNSIDLAADVGSTVLPEARVDPLIARKSFVTAGFQPLSTLLTSISGAAVTANNLLVANGTGFASTAPAGVRAALGLGSFALLNGLAYSALTGLPTLGSLAAKDSINLAADVGTTVLPDARIDPLIARKSYVDSQTTTVGTGLTKTGTQLTVNADQSQITKVGSLQGLSVIGDATVSGNVVVTTAPTLGTHLTNRSYVTGLTYLTPSTGLALTNGSLSLNANQTFANLTVTGSTTVAEPTLATHSSTKGYVDSQTTTVGTGLTKTGTQISVNADQSQITKVGSLLGLSVTGDATVSGNVIANTVPTLASHLTNRAYVNGLSYLTAGTGLTLASNTLSVNTTQPQIVTLGTQTALAVAGTSTFGNTLAFPNNTSFYTTVGTVSGNPGVSMRFRLTDAVNTEARMSIGNLSTTGSYSSRIALYSLNTLETSANNERIEFQASSAGGAINWVAGGTGIARPLSVYSGALVVAAGGTGVTISNPLTIGTQINYPNAISTTSGTGAGFQSFRVINTDATNTDSRITVTNTAVAGGYPSKLRLHALGHPAVTDQESLELVAGPTGGTLRWLTGGTGVARTFNIYNSLQFTMNGPINSLNTTPATSPTVASFTFAGGIGVTGDVYTSGSQVATTALYAPYVGLGVTGINSVSGLGYVSTAGALASNSAVGDLVFRTTSSATPAGIIRLGNSSGASTFDVLPTYGVTVNGTYTQLARAVNDSTTAAAGTNATPFAYKSIAAPTLTATNTAVTRTNAATLSISGPPVAGLNTTITNASALNVASGASVFGGTGTFSGRITGASQEEAISMTTGSITTLGGISAGKNIHGASLRLNNSLTDNFTRPIANVYSGYTGQQMITMGNSYSQGNCMEVGYTHTGTVNYAHFGLYQTTGLQVFSDQRVVCPFTTESVDENTGALSVRGGLGVAKNANISGSLFVPTGGVTYNHGAITAGTYNVQLTDHFLACDTSAGTVTVILPTATGIKGKTFKFGKVTNDFNQVRIDTTGTETINGLPEFILQNPYSTIQVISSDNGKWNIISFSPQSSSSGGVFPESVATDGSVTLAANTTLVRNMVYENLTVPAGISLNASGWRIVCTGTLTLNGRIHFDGVSGNGVSGGSQGITALTTFLGNGLPGVAGRTTAGDGTAGTAAATYRTVGGAGGAGGNASAANTGGLGSTMLPIPAVDGGPSIMAVMPSCFAGRIFPTAGSVWVQGGGAGGSGSLVTNAAQGTYSSGGSGSGGGCLVVAARTITGVGKVSANGGNGGNGIYNRTAGTAVPICTGGGGGGGGYCALLYQYEYSSTITVEANGGMPGTSIGAPITASQPGQAGQAYKIAL